MYKVLLITIQNPGNFGNRLQNYALQTILERLGCLVYNLSVTNMNITTVRKIKIIVANVLSFCGMKRYVSSASEWGRRRKGVVFSNDYIHNFIFIQRDKLSTLNFTQYDAAVTGSDQVWHNWKRLQDELSYYYLDFIAKEKRIAYAPSFGFPKFPQDDIEKHRKGLNGMKALSCREQEGCDLIYKLTGRTAQKVVDPTLLLTAGEWELIEKKPKFSLPEKYLLQFMLGSVSQEFRREIERVSHLRKIQVLNINDLNDSKHYIISPSEFIWLIHHADTICTDSFHASVFSILFERNLRVFERISPEFGNMFGRLHDLLKPLGLMKLVYNNMTYKETDLSTALGIKEKEYLQNEKKTSISYLKDSLISQ